MSNISIIFDGPDRASGITYLYAWHRYRDGSPDEKGTYEFQQNFVRYHLGFFATKPWLSGAVYFALREFECRPGWAGGNPLPQPPLHQKGLVAYNGTPKPAYADVQQIYRATQQVGLAR